MSKLELKANAESVDVVKNIVESLAEKFATQADKGGSWSFANREVATDLRAISDQLTSLSTTVAEIDS